MTTHNSDKSRKSRLWVVAMVALAGGACTRDQVDKGVDRVSDTTHRVADKVDVSLHNAKTEAERLKEKLPSTDEVKSDLDRATQQVDAKLRAAGDNIKREANEARDSVREHVSK